MKSRASLVLMEQLIMVLIFALAAAMCLRILVKADRLCEETARRDEAVLLAQNAAESLKSCGDPEEVFRMVDCGEYALEILTEPTDIPGFAQAKVTVRYEGEELAALRTGWQEVGG